MKIAVFDDFRIGLVRGDRILDVTGVVPAALDGMPELRMRWVIGNWSEAAPRIEQAAASATARPLAQVTLRAANPGARHVFAAPGNYLKHIGELGSMSVIKPGRTAREQGFFLKAPASVAGAGEAIVLPKGSRRRFDHESELAVIIGKHGRNVRREDAMDHVFGYACLIDATMRIEKDVNEEERSMRKSFATFTPVGPYVVTRDEVADPGALEIRLWVNDELRQSASTADMVVGVAELIELISSVLPIEPGDIIATGTPSGVGQFKAGDTVRIRIEGVGEMALPVREADTAAPRAY